MNDFEDDIDIDEDLLADDEDYGSRFKDDEVVDDEYERKVSSLQHDHSEKLKEQQNLSS